MKSEQGINLKDGFADCMKGRILSGELKPGDRLPPERELAKQYGISRGSVNQGLLDLERIGFLRIVPRKGTFVTEYVACATPETLTAIMGYDSALIDRSLFIDLMDMRILIERQCVRLACRRMDEASGKLLREKLRSITCADASGISKAIYDYHRCITIISGNSAYSIVFQSFEKVLINLIETHYSEPSELGKCLPLYKTLTAYMCRPDEKKSDEVITRLLGIASEYLSSYLEKRGQSL